MFGFWHKNEKTASEFNKSFLRKFETWFQGLMTSCTAAKLREAKNNLKKMYCQLYCKSEKKTNFNNKWQFTFTSISLLFGLINKISIKARRSDLMGRNSLKALKLHNYCPKKISIPTLSTFLAARTNCHFRIHFKWPYDRLEKSCNWKFFTPGQV